VYGVLRRHPAALAAMARYYACGCVEGARQGYRTARRELAEHVPPHAVDGLLAAYRTVCRSNIELPRLNWDYAAWWYSLISPVTTGLRRTDRRSATSQLGCVSMSGGRCCRDWCGLWPL
jgi:hypothetical protein